MREPKAQASVLSHSTSFPGGLSGGETPVSIPNTEVKTSSADDTAWATVWESRPPPWIFMKQLVSKEAGCFVISIDMTRFEFSEDDLLLRCTEKVFARGEQLFHGNGLFYFQPFAVIIVAGESPHGLFAN